MSILHTVNKSPYGQNALDSCLKLASKGSAVLLIEDGIYGGLKAGSKASMIGDVIGDVKVFVLGPDLKARGIDADRMIDGIEIVDYAGFVDLAAEHDKVSAWL